MKRGRTTPKFISKFSSHCTGRLTPKEFNWNNSFKISARRDKKLWLKRKLLKFPYPRLTLGHALLFLDK